MIWVAAAGPAANLVMALGWAMVMKIGLVLPMGSGWIATPLILAGQAGIVINLVLFLLNMLPVPPLDGGRILTGLAPARFTGILTRIEPAGMFIVFGLLAIGGLQAILYPPLRLLSSIIGGFFGIPI